MRRFRTSSSRARKSSAVFGILALAALVGGLLPSAASAQTDPAATPAPTVEPAPAETEAPDDGVIRDGYTTDPTGEPTAEPTAEPTEAPAPTAEPTPEPTEAPEDDIVGEIPTPENGDYIGSNIEDEADPGAYSATQDGLRAATLSGFRPGNIISDAKMYTSGTMSASQIQSFFNGKVRSCDPNYTCLKDFKMNTVSKSPNSYCTGSYQGGRNESAATIISKVSKACKVSEKVLIVMLQKEQGLVTHTWPSQFRYDIAMGYACPDDAACNAKYFGFQNQMYMAAYQLQRYTKDSYFSWYPVGKTSQVRYHPNASCGSGAVRIENKATAALYYYTPYQPNRAALNAGYGVGDSCSAYGNRNFYNYYTDWFGGTREPSKPSKPNTPSVTGAIGEKWKSLGGASGKLGQPISAEKCGLSRYNGCYQDFQGGQIFWSKKTGAHFTTGSIRVEWRSGGAQNGSLGYPTSDERCGLAKGGCYQVFEGGGVYWSPATGASTVGGKILPGWNAVNKEKGALGYPNANLKCGLKHSGCYQAFQGGAVYSSSNGSVPVTRAILQGWSEVNRENGSLGYPKRAMTCGLKNGGCYQQFSGGATFWSSATGGHAVANRMIAGWKAGGKESGKLGYPTTSTKCGLKGGACYQQFAGGKVYSSKAGGSQPIYGSIMNRYQDLGNEHSRLGYPTSGEKCTYAGGACRQQFEHGYIQWTPGKGTIVRYS